MGKTSKTKKEFILEIIDHETGQVTGSAKGNAYYLCVVLKDILDELPTGHGVGICYEKNS
jgi:hypothetical protein